MITRAALLFLGAVFCVAVLGQSLGYAFPSQLKNKEQKLVAKIVRENNPGKKARLQLRLARLKLMSAINTYDHNDFQKGLALLEEYRQQIDRSWKTLEGSKRGVAKHFVAYKKLEIGLREDERLLEDLRRRVPYSESEAVEKIAKETSRVHRQVLGALFPPGKPPQKSKKPGRSSGLLAATTGAVV